MDDCSLRIFTETACHLDTLTSKNELLNVTDLHSEEKLLLKFRFKDFQVDEGSICLHHKLEYLDYYSRRFKICCDPFNAHRKSQKNELRIIDLETVGEAVQYMGIKLTPGDKWCRNCQRTFKTDIEKLKTQV